MDSLVNYRTIYELLNSREDSKGKLFDWGAIANMYDGMAKLEKEYTLNQVAQVPVTCKDTLVDIGCGPGRLSVPLAKKAKSVTSVDAFEEMLSVCKKNANEEGIKNINFLKKNWEDKDAIEIIGKHDVVVASRTVALSDVLRLNQLANKYVVIMSFANAPSLREIQLDFLDGILDTELTKKQMQIRNSRIFGYNIVFNMIYDLGANPSVVVVDDGFEKDFASKQEAYEHLRFVGDIPKDKEDIYKKNVDKYLIRLQNGSYKLHRKTKSYVMWWKPEELKTNL